MQKYLEACKTIVGASNRSRVGTGVVGDDFMDWWRPLDAERVPSRLAATRGVSPSSLVHRRAHPASTEPWAQLRSRKILL